MFFAGEALYAGPDIGTVGQRPRDGAAIMNRVSADTIARPLNAPDPGAIGGARHPRSAE